MRAREIVMGSVLARILMIAISVWALTVSVRADGGTVLWQRADGPFIVTVFTAQSPLRVGQADLSVLLQDAEGAGAIVDAKVFIELEHEMGAIISAEATHKQARNKLLYCSLVNLPEEGNWTMKVFVRRGGDHVEVPGEFTVVAAQSMILEYWKLLVFPPVVVVIFIVNQIVQRGRGGRSSKALQ